jgi:homoserine acetyltransferase
MGGFTQLHVIYIYGVEMANILEIASSARFDSRNKAPSAVLSKSQMAGSAYQ